MPPANESLSSEKAKAVPRTFLHELLQHPNLVKGSWKSVNKIPNITRGDKEKW